MNGSRILVTGGSGFVGGQVLRLLAAGGDRVRVLRHRRAPGAAAGGAPYDAAPAAAGLIETVTGDLGDPATLRGLCSGVGTVLHLASRIGGDAEECRRVNELGTAALLAEAERAGVRRIVLLSTTAVYRDGVHRGAREDELPLGPGSVTSRTRLAGERQALAADAVVVRPHLIYGAGDQWVVPTLLQVARRIPHWVAGGRALASVIAVDDLARQLVALARAPWAPKPGGEVYHACEPRPVAIRELTELAARRLGLPLPVGEITTGRALALLGAEGLPEEQLRLWERRLSLIGVDHWYRADRLWQRTGEPPSPGLAANFARHADWYAERHADSHARQQAAVHSAQPV